MFVTDKEYNQTFFYVVEDHKEKDKNKRFKKYVYLPQLFEKKSNQYIKNYQKWLSTKFIFWTLFNKDKFHVVDDYRTILSRFIDINTSLMLVMFGSFVSYRFLRRLEAPFLELMLEDKFLNFKQLK